MFREKELRHIQKSVFFVIFCYPRPSIYGIANIDTFATHPCRQLFQSHGWFGYGHHTCFRRRPHAKSKGPNGSAPFRNSMERSRDYSSLHHLTLIPRAMTLHSLAVARCAAAAPVRPCSFRGRGGRDRRLHRWWVPPRRFAARCWTRCDWPTCSWLLGGWEGDGFRGGFKGNEQQLKICIL